VGLTKYSNQERERSKRDGRIDRCVCGDSKEQKRIETDARCAAWRGE
jgi:hypothetical protein